MSSEDEGSRGVGGEVGKSTLTTSGPSAASPEPGRSTLVQNRAASRGVAGASRPLPYLEQIRRAFGHHDVSNVTATIGGEAAAAGEELGVAAYAYGDRIAFAAPPDLHTAAHEAAHVVQQRAGITAPDDSHEQHADAVADAVVAGQSAEQLLDMHASKETSVAAPVIQRKAKASVDATTFVENHAVLFNDEVRNALAGIKMVPRGPYGAALARSALEEEITTAIVDAEKGGSMTSYYQRFVEPDDIVTLIDRARGHDWLAGIGGDPLEFRDAGPSTPTYVSGVAIEVANAIARRYLPAARRYMERLLQRHVRAMTKKAEDAPQLPDARPDPKAMHRDGPMMDLYDLSDLVTSHPVDVVVKQALADAQTTIDLEGIAKTRPDLWSKFAPKLIDPLSGTTEVPDAETDAPLRPVTIELKTHEGLHHWVSAATTDGKPATREEVAAALFETGRDRDSATQYAHYLIDVSPLWGFPGRVVSKFKPQHWHALLLRGTSMVSEAMSKAASYADGDGPPTFPEDIAVALGMMTHLGTGLSRPRDPMLELASEKPLLARQRAKLAVRPEDTDKDELSLVVKLDEAVKLCLKVQEPLDVIGRNSPSLTAFHDELVARRTEAYDHSLQDVPAQWTLVEQQMGVLRTIADGLSELAVRRTRYSITHDDGDVQIDGAILSVIDDARRPFEDALVALDFPEVAAGRAALGLQRAQLIDITINEVLLHRGMEQVNAEIERDDETPELDGAGAKKATDRHTYDLGANRMLTMQEPGVGKIELDEKSETLDTFHFDISIGAKLGAIDDIWKTIDNDNDFWSWRVDDFKGHGLKAESNALRMAFFVEVYTPWLVAKAANDKAAMTAVRKAFRTFVTERIPPFIGKVQEFLDHSASHKYVKKFVASLFIAAAAFAVGGWAFAGLRLAGAGVWEAAVVAGGSTSMTQMILEKAILDHDPTLGSVIMGFAGNVATFGIVGKMSMAARAAGVATQVGDATVGAAAKLAEGAEVAAAAAKQGSIATAIKGFAKEIILGEVFMLVSAEGQSLIDNGRMLNGPELLECAAMGVANVVGMKIAQYPFEKTAEMYRAFKGAKLEGKADIAGLTAMGVDLAARGAELNTAAGGPGHLAKGPAPRKAAQELLAKWDEYQAKSHEVDKALSELRAKHPERFKMKAAELEAAGKEHDAHMLDAATLHRQLQQARALLGVEEIGPGLYRGDPAAMNVIIAEHKASFSELLTVATDAITGQRTLTFRTADGATIEVIERIADPKDRKPPNVPVPKARHFEAWLDAIDTRTTEGALKRTRLIDAYAKDAEMAIRSAETEHGYKPGEAPAPNRMAAVKAMDVAAEQARITRIQTGVDHVRGPAELSTRDVADALNSQLQNVKAAEIDAIVSKHPGQEARVRTVLARSSGFGKMEGLNALRTALQPHFDNGKKLYAPGQGSLGDAVSYLDYDKHSFDKTHASRPPRSVTDIGKNTIVILDPVVLAKMKDPVNGKAYGRSLLAEGVVVLQPRGFVDGNNMYNVGNSDVIAQRAESVLKRATAIEASERVSFDDAVGKALDEQQRQAFEAQDRDVATALSKRLEVVDPAALAGTSSAAIADQVNSAGHMTEAKVEAALAKVPQADRPYLRELLAQQTQIFSPRRQANEIAQLEQKVLGLGVPKQKVFYFIPIPDKSYTMVAMAHREATGTGTSHYIEGPTELKKAMANGTLDSASMLVIIDDVAGSGISMVEASHEAQLSGYNGRIAVAPIVSTGVANLEFTGPKEKANVTYAPGRISPALRETDYFKKLSIGEQNHLEKHLLVDLGFDDNALCTVFPYMAPDNNNRFFGKEIAPEYVINRNDDERAVKSYGPWTPTQKPLKVTP